MPHKRLKPTRKKQERRARAAAPAAGQYSLFAAAPIGPDADARHFLPPRHFLSHFGETLLYACADVKIEAHQVTTYAGSSRES